MAINKKTLAELKTLRSKWKLGSKVALKNPTRYVLMRAKSDVNRVFPEGASDTVMTEWQTRCLAEVAGIGTHTEVAEEAVTVAVEAVKHAFGDFEEGTLRHHMGNIIAEDVVATVQETLGVAVTTGSVAIISGPSSEVQVVEVQEEEEPEPDISPKYSIDWVKKIGIVAGAFLLGICTVGLPLPGNDAYAYAYGAETLVPVVEVPVQSFAVSADVEVPAVKREEYTVSVRVVPQAPLVRTGVTGSRGGISAAKGEAAFYAALGQKGTPYVFGGASPSGFDCSGLIMWAYAQQGISLGHGVRQQSARGFIIPESEARLGDLVVMNGHNGFWAGNGMILDAPRAGKVVSVRPIWTNSYWIVRLAG